jgi:hypothetical protein
MPVKLLATFFRENNTYHEFMKRALTEKEQAAVIYKALQEAQSLSKPNQRKMLLLLCTKEVKKLPLLN